MQQPLYSVPPNAYSEKNLMDSVRDMFSEKFPVGSVNMHDQLGEFVTWAKFESNVNISNKVYYLFILLGTNRGFYVWSIKPNGLASLLYSKICALNLSAKLIPSPLAQLNDCFQESRPLLATCWEQNNFRGEVQFSSLSTGCTEVCFTTTSSIRSIDANKRFVIVCRIDCISVLSAHTLLELFSISNVKPIFKSTSTNFIPLALSSRWLAFADIKPVYHHLSRCGDASDDSSQPVATTMLNVNKRIWDGLFALANSVSIGNQTCTGNIHNSFSDSVRGVHGNQLRSNVTGLPETSIIPTEIGYVTIVDLVSLAEEYSTHNTFDSPETAQCPLSTTTAIQKPCDCSFDYSQKGTNVTDNSKHVLSSERNRIDTHKFSASGSMVAHFLAHRWANVGYLEFDSTGSLLFTACQHGHSFHIFRIFNHPQDLQQTAIHHLYILNRGSTPCEIVDASFSHDSRWIAVISNHGTSHVYPITPYGGQITVRTHLNSCVVNRTSRYHRSSGFDEYHLTKPQRTRVVGAGSLVEFANATSTGSAAAINDKKRVSNKTCQAAILHMSENSRFSICPHVGAPDTVNQTNLTADFGQDVKCACPPNAIYNISNARLPPYPEPCTIQPEARIRPRLSSRASNSGYAAAALSAASGAFEVVSAATGASGSHYNPSPVPLATGSHLQPLSFCGGACVASCFHPPVCFLPLLSKSPTDKASRCRSDHRSNQFMDALFVITRDMHLIEFDSNLYNDQVYQDEPIKLKCEPVGQWRLHADSVFLPPFSDDHPLLSVFNINQSKSPVKSQEYVETADIITENPTLVTNAESSSVAINIPLSASRINTTSYSLPEMHASRNEILKPTASGGWTKDDAASYWYSRIELTSHFGPFRRIWMGPQFYFKVFPFNKEDMSETDSFLFESQTNLLDIHHSTDLHSDELQPSRSYSSSGCFLNSVCELPGSEVEMIEKNINSMHINIPNVLQSDQLTNPVTLNYFELPKNSNKLRHQSAEAISYVNNRCFSKLFRDGRVLIDGGNYRDSSPGDFLCSGQSVENVAHDLAEAMQDEDSVHHQQHHHYISSTLMSPCLRSPNQNFKLSPNCEGSSTEFVTKSPRNSLFVSESDFPIHSEANQCEALKIKQTMVSTSGAENFNLNCIQPVAKQAYSSDVRESCLLSTPQEVDLAASKITSFVINVPINLDSDCGSVSTLPSKQSDTISGTSVRSAVYSKSPNKSKKKFKRKKNENLKKELPPEQINKSETIILHSSLHSQQHKSSNKSRLVCDSKINDCLTEKTKETEPYDSSCAAEFDNEIE